MAYPHMDVLILDDIDHGSGQTLSKTIGIIEMLPSEHCSVHTVNSIHTVSSIIPNLLPLLIISGCLQCAVAKDSFCRMTYSSNGKCCPEGQISHWQF